MNRLIALKWYNLILDCNSVTESASLSLYRIRKSKPLYFNISQGRNRSSFCHWNRTCKSESGLRKLKPQHQAIFINSVCASAFGTGHWNASIQFGRATLVLWVTDGSDLKVSKFSKEGKSNCTLSTSFGAFWESSFYLNPQHLFHLFFLINHN